MGGDWNLQMPGFVVVSKRAAPLFIRIWSRERAMVWTPEGKMSFQNTRGVVENTLCLVWDQGAPTVQACYNIVGRSPTYRIVCAKYNSLVDPQIGWRTQNFATQVCGTIGRCIVVAPHGTHWPVNLCRAGKY